MRADHGGPVFEPSWLWLGRPDRKKQFGRSIGGNIPPSREPVIREKIVPTIYKLALDEKLEIIDLHPFFKANPVLMPDKVHPSSLGAAKIARRLYEVVLPL